MFKNPHLCACLHPHVNKSGHNIVYIMSYLTICIFLYLYYIFQTITHDPVLKPKQPKTMRWLSHDKACETLRQILPSVIMSLEREASERHDSLAIGLSKNIQYMQFISILYTTCDALPQLSILSKCFQVS